MVWYSVVGTMWVILFCTREWFANLEYHKNVQIPISLQYSSFCLLASSSSLRRLFPILVSPSLSPFRIFLSLYPTQLFRYSLSDIRP